MTYHFNATEQRLMLGVRSERKTLHMNIKKKIKNNLKHGDLFMKIKQSREEEKSYIGFSYFPLSICFLSFTFAAIA